MTEVMNEGPEQIIKSVMGEILECEEIKFSQQIEIAEIATGCEMNNKYVVKIPSGQIVMKIKEKTSFGTRCCCGSARPMKIVKFKVFDPNDQKKKALVMTARRDCAVICCCTVVRNNFYLQATSDGDKMYDLAEINQKTNACKPGFFIETSKGEHLQIYIKNSFLADMFIPKERKFFIDIDNVTVTIKRLFKLKNLISDADSFSIELPKELREKKDANEKILLLIGLCFVIDISCYERSGKANRGMLQYQQHL